jgi:hypothetical protein
VSLVLPPSEILDITGFYFGSATSFKLILGMQVDRKQAFQEEGFGVVILLGKFSFSYLDRYTLINIKRYLVNKRFLLSRQFSPGRCVLTMASEIRNSNHSDYAVEIGFVDAIDFIGHDIFIFEK